jgi:cobalt-zinc-cadmium resistance protein CzcA
MVGKAQNRKVYFLFWYLVLCLLQNTSPVYAQPTNSLGLSLEECLQMAYSRNELLKVANLEYTYYGQHKKSLYEIPKTSLIYTQGQFNSIYPYDNIISLTQVVPFPTYFKAQAELGNAQIKGAEIRKEVVKAELAFRVKEVYYTLQHLIQESTLLSKEDSIYEVFLQLAEKEISNSMQHELEEATTVTKAHLIQNAYNRMQQEVNDNRIKLQYLLRSEQVPEIKVLPEGQRILEPDTNSNELSNQPNLRYLKEQIEISRRQKLLEKQKSIPDLHLSYFNQSIYGPANIYGDNYFLSTSDRLQGFQVGLLLPLYYGPQRAKIRAGKLNEEIAQEYYTQMQKDMEGQFRQVVNSYLLNKKNLEYYEEFILKNSRKMVVQSLDAFNSKQINYIEYLSLVNQSFENARVYLNMIYENNLSVIKIEYYLYGSKN